MGVLPVRLDPDHARATPDTSPASEIGDHSYVAYLEVDDIQAYYARAKNAGAEVGEELKREPWGREEFGIRSPDGHRFMVAGRNPPRSAVKAVGTRIKSPIAGSEWMSTPTVGDDRARLGGKQFTASLEYWADAPSSL